MRRFFVISLLVVLPSLVAAGDGESKPQPAIGQLGFFAGYSSGNQLCSVYPLGTDFEWKIHNYVSLEGLGFLSGSACGVPGTLLGENLRKIKYALLPDLVFLLPTEIASISVTPKLGIGYGLYDAERLKFSGFFVIAGVEADFFEWLIVEIEYLLAIGSSIAEQSSPSATASTIDKRFSEFRLKTTIPISKKTRVGGIVSFPSLGELQPRLYLLYFGLHL